LFDIKLLILLLIITISSKCAYLKKPLRAYATKDLILNLLLLSLSLVILRNRRTTLQRVRLKRKS